MHLGNLGTNKRPVVETQKQHKKITKLTMDYTPELLEKQFNLIPDDVKNALSSEATAVTLREIGEKNGLLEDRINSLINETGLVMLGITHPSSFVSNLTTKMGISRENAQRIAAQVNESIFMPIRDSLKKIHNIGSAGGPSQTTPSREEVLHAIEDTPKKVDISPADPSTAQHAEKLEKITVRPPEEIHAVDQQPQQKPPPYHEGDPYREPV